MQNRLNRGFACIFNCWQSLSLFEIPTHPIKSPVLWVFLISKKVHAGIKYPQNLENYQFCGYFKIQIAFSSKQNTHRIMKSINFVGISGFKYSSRRSKIPAESRKVLILWVVLNLGNTHKI